MGELSGFEHLKAVVVSHGYGFETHPVDVAALREMTDDLELPPAFCSLYSEHSPVPQSSIPWVVEEMMVFSFDELPEAQAGYRWVEGPQRTRSPSWPANWVVVASVFGDPFFVDTSREACPVLFARHGAGSWSPIEVANSMELFIESLAVFESVLLGSFDLEVWGDDGLLPEFVDDVEHKLARVLGSAQASVFAGLIG